jgi:16S rRNA (cytosine967-C5)-methyltransferase
VTPPARAQAAIELLDEIIASARSGGAAADTIIARYFKTRRYAGSKDRRAVRELVYRAIRRSAEPPPSGRAAMLGLIATDLDLRALFDGSPHGPDPIAVGDQAASGATVPGWLIDRFDPLITADEHMALLERAPLDVRVNRLKTDRVAVQSGLPVASATPHSHLGLRLPDGFPMETHPSWQGGLVEVQDEGSQLLSLACAAQPGITVLDFCAGAGGKSLALAAEMENRGRLVASDTDRQRLSRMEPRLARAGVGIVETRLLDPGKEADALADLEGCCDLVLVDAPCSGSGTWRRNPETRWRLNPERLARLVNLQAHLLDLASDLVKPGGALVYAVCSLLAEEGRDQAAALEKRSSLVPEAVDIPAGRVSGSGRILSPAHDGTDGFFVARWRKPC